MIRDKKFKKPFVFALGALGFVITMVGFPTAVFDASKAGIAAWWNIVFPALFPFFVASELLMSYGLVQFMGVLLEPVMRPLFNLPGASSFVMAVGYTSGFPISASLTGRLRKDGLCSRFEAERLMSFTNNASPLFMLVAVGVGMFHNPRIGILIALSHYLANFLLGLTLRFYRSRDPGHSTVIIYKENLYHKAVSEMQKAINQNRRPFGKVLADAITSSINKLLLIGGFVIIFSVIIKLSVVTGFMSILKVTIGTMTGAVGFDESIVESLGRGFFEITLGAKAASEAAAPLTQKIIAATVILGWSGVSVLAQVAAMISETDLKMGLFVVSRFIQSFVSGFLCYFLLSVDSVQSWMAKPVSTSQFPKSLNFITSLNASVKLTLFCVAGWILIGFAVHIIRSFRFIRFRA